MNQSNRIRPQLDKFNFLKHRIINQTQPKPQMVKYHQPGKLKIIKENL